MRKLTDMTLISISRIIKSLCIIIILSICSQPLSLQAQLCGSTILQYGTFPSGTNSSSGEGINYFPLTGCPTNSYESAVLYEFEAIGTNIELTFLPILEGPYTIAIVDDCENLSIPYFSRCDDNQFNELICGLTVGETYFIQVSSSSANEGLYNIGIDYASGYGASHDNCSTALILPSNEWTQASTYCTDGFVWFEYVVQFGNFIDIDINGITITPGIQQVLLATDGGNCNSAISISANESCLTPGDVIYIEAGVNPGAGSYGEFEIIVNDLNVSYDECELANDLGTLSCNSKFDYEGLALSCPDINTGGCLGDIVDHGTWIKFDIDPAVEYFYISGNHFEVFTGNDCNTLLSIGCSGDPSLSEIQNLNSTYWALIDSLPDDNGSIEIEPRHCCTAEAGILEPIDDICPGETLTIDPEGNETDNLYQTYIYLLDENDIIIDRDFMNFSYEFPTICADYKIIVYNLYVANIGPIPIPYIPLIGDDISDFDCVTSCCDFEIQAFSAVDNEAPIFIDPPQDVTIECFDVPSNLPLAYTDNCQDNGMLSGSDLAINIDVCEISIIERTWTYTDDCFNTVSHTQTITMEPLAPAQLDITGFEDLSLNCGDAVPELMTIPYSNGLAGLCSNEGNIFGSEITNNINACEGGIIERFWEGSDKCGNPLEHTQTITILPPSPPQIINAPTDFFITCGEPLPLFVDIAYSNGITGDCELFGTFNNGMQVGTPDPCGNLITYEYAGMDMCGNPLEYTQTIIIEPASLPTIVNPPADLTISCGDPLPPLSQLMYDNGLFGDCNISGVINGTQNGSADCGSIVQYEYSGISECGDSLNYTQTITILEEATDLSLSLSFVPSIAVGPTDMAWQITLFENNGFATDETITVILPKDPRLSFSFDPNLSALGPYTFDNSDWILDNSNASFYIWNSAKVIPASGSTAFGFLANYNPGNTNGTLSFTATLVSGSGGELLYTNNIDAELLQYFSN